LFVCRKKTQQRLVRDRIGRSFSFTRYGVNLVVWISLIAALTKGEAHI